MERIMPNLIYILDQIEVIGFIAFVFIVALSPAIYLLYLYLDSLKEKPNGD